MLDVNNGWFVPADLAEDLEGKQTLSPRLDESNVRVVSHLLLTRIHSDPVVRKSQIKAFDEFAGV